MDPKEIDTKLDALNERAQELLAQAEAKPSEAAEVKALIENEIAPEVKLLKDQRQRTEQTESVKAVQDSLENLNNVIDELRKPSGAFKVVGSKIEGKGVEVDDPYAEGGFSPYTDVYLARRGNADARERLTHNAEDRVNGGYGDSLTAEGKAMSEASGAVGGYLVQPLLERQLVLARERDNVIRGLASSITINTNSIQLDQLGLSTTAGWVAELAAKPESNGLTLATITASIYTAAGLATVSNQLLADSNPSIDGLLTTDLAKRLVALEETAFLEGSGTGEPLGILNTSGIGAITYTDTENKDPAATGGILDKVLESIAQVQENWGQPSAIVMHPRTWTSILKSRDTAGHYTIAPRNIVTAGYDPETPRTYITGPEQTLFGVPVILSNRIPTNKGSGTNESRIIVGDFKEALVLDRQGITIDESEHVYFTTNATVFRAESRVGFTAARQPKAFSVIGGTGLASR